MTRSVSRKGKLEMFDCSGVNCGSGQLDSGNLRLNLTNENGTTGDLN